MDFLKMLREKYALDESVYNNSSSVENISNTSDLFFGEYTLAQESKKSSEKLASRRNPTVAAADMTPECPLVQGSLNAKTAARSGTTAKIRYNAATLAKITATNDMLAKRVTDEADKALQFRAIVQKINAKTAKTPKTDRPTIGHHADTLPKLSATNEMTAKKLADKAAKVMQAKARVQSKGSNANTAMASKVIPVNARVRMETNAEATVQPDGPKVDDNLYSLPKLSAANKKMARKLAEKAAKVMQSKARVQELTNVKMAAMASNVMPVNARETTVQPDARARTSANAKTAETDGPTIGHNADTLVKLSATNKKTARKLSDKAAKEMQSKDRVQSKGTNAKTVKASKAIPVNARVRIETITVQQGARSVQTETNAKTATTDTQALRPRRYPKMVTLPVRARKAPKSPDHDGQEGRDEEKVQTTTVAGSSVPDKSPV